ncbi:hypothetical protein OEZ86_014580 [Tetradesmus obliquus]|nr:hypothetical protein OEZ86_014580 [Tetradesmus obliquus]
MHVFWDLDNLKPEHWGRSSDLVRSLRSALKPYGRLQQLQGYANSHTLVRQVEGWGLQEELEEEDTRCPLCGRRCKSFDDLQKHFRQLHEREHQKKLGAPKKHAAKYSKSDKAARVREARSLYGTPKKNRAGSSGQLVRAVLQKAGVKVFEVASQKQAADEAIDRHIDRLLDELQTAEPRAAAPAAAAAAAADDADDLAAGEVSSALRPLLAALPSADACLKEMRSMSEGDLRSAWAYLKKVGSHLPKKQQKWSKIWTNYIQRPRSNSKFKPGDTPTWLAHAWDAYHYAIAQQQQQQQQVGPAAEDADMSAAAQLPSAPAAASALQQSVLVVVSDDRGFASSVCRWLRKGGAGVMLVTTRSMAGWEAPLRAALAGSAAESSNGWLEGRLDDIVIISWDDVMDGVEPVAVRGEDLGSDVDDDGVWGWDVFSL